MTNPLHEIREELAEKLHIWYLEATKELKPESYNPNAQKSYADLTEEQRFIDRYIAEKFITHLLEQLLKEIGEDEPEPPHAGYNAVEGAMFAYAKATNTERKRIRDLVTSRLHITKE